MALRGGRYETLREIASGGMAKVHLGRALGAGGFERLVAIKAMHPHLAGEQEFVDMFLDEARLAARIRHPNVVGTIDVQQDAEGIFLVMEYVEGPPLSAILKERRRVGDRVPIEVSLRIFLDVLAGLQAAHDLAGGDGAPLQLVHRDVSPQNILVGVDGIARITDFGIARAESRLSSTQGNQVKGKVPYMAPEQVQGLPIDRRTDVYAAGAVLWELLTGERLVRGENVAECIRKIMSGPPRSPLEVNPRVAEPLSEACQKALRPSPDERFATAAAFAEAIEQAALVSGITITTIRVVSMLVKDLKLHASPTDLPSSSQIRPPSASSNPSANFASLSIQARSGDGTAAEPESTKLGAVMPSERELKVRRSGALLVAIAGGGVLVGALAVFLVLQRSFAPSGRPFAASAPTDATASPAPSSLVAPTGALAEALSAEAPTTAAAPSVLTAAPSSSPSAAPRALVKPASPLPRSNAAAPKTGGPRPPKEKSKPDPRNATSFRPKEL
jgi:serine/threonine protein kinase